MARGIACSRHDIPPFIKEAQADLLKVMATVPDRKSLEDKLPEILDHLGDYVARLKEAGWRPRDRSSPTVQRIQTRTKRVIQRSSSLGASFLRHSTRLRTGQHIQSRSNIGPP